MIAKWTSLDWAERLMLFEAACFLTAAHLAVHLLHFRRLAPRLGYLGNTASETPLSLDQRRQAQQVGWAVTVLARYFPVHAKCLAQAAAGKWMLQRREMPSDLYLGVDHAQSGDGWLEAHAWLRCGSEFVTGEPQHKRFKVIAVFTEDGS